ncbi:hypothetical protein LQW54_005201 [Pestalotiopsis sp. IQ-011]
MFLNDPKLKSQWAVRRVTRDVSKASSNELAKQGVEVVAWEKLDLEDEIQQGKNMADAAKETRVQHFTWSALIDVTKREMPSPPAAAKHVSNGALPHVYHFDSKAKVEEYVRELGIPATFFMPRFYMPNIPGEMMRAWQLEQTSLLALQTICQEYPA